MSRIVESLYNNILTEASLTPEEKMYEWHNGRRRENIKACGDKKLLQYYDICAENHWGTERQIISDELKSRGYEWNPLSGTFEKSVNPAQTSKPEPKELTCKFLNNTLYILANNKGTDFLKQFYDDVYDLPTTELDDSIYFVITQDFPFANDVARRLIKELNL